MTGNEIMKENREANLWKFAASIQDPLNELKALREENKALRELLIDAWCKDDVHPLSNHNEKKCDWCIERKQFIVKNSNVT